MWPVITMVADMSGMGGRVRLSRRLVGRGVAIVTCAVIGSELMVGVASVAGATVVGMSAAVHVRGPGTAYAGGMGSVVSLAVKSGGTATFGVEVFNTGQDPSAFALDVGGAGGAFVVETGGKPAQRDFAGMYPTVVLAPGKAQTFSVSVTAPHEPYGETGVQVLVRRSDDQGILDSASLMVNIDQLTKNTFDLYLTSPKQASYPLQPTSVWDQPFVGGPTVFPTETAPSIGATGAAKFLVRLKNDGQGVRRIGFGMTDNTQCSGTFPTTVTDAGVDITDSVLQGQYLTPVLSSGSQRDLVVTVRYNAASPSCNHETWWLRTIDPAQPAISQEAALLNTNLAAS